MKDALVICTRNRPLDVRTCLESVAAQTERPACVLVADSSEDPATEEVLRSFSAVRHLRVAPGLTRQRNRAVAALPAGVEIVHFIDDDTVLERDYVAAIRREFSDLAVVGVGGVMTNVRRRQPRLLYRFFLLDSRRPGAILRSGRNILATGLEKPTRVDWLSGCSMSFRAEVLRARPFEESLTGYCFGEDVEYCLRVGADGVLVATPFARLEHRVSPVNRYSAFRWYTTEIVARHWRVHRFPGRLSRTAFWWSVVGEFGLALAKSLVFRRRSPLLLARAVTVGSWCILTGDRKPVIE